MAIDPAGSTHELARRVDQVKAVAVHARTADIDTATLPSVAEAKEQQQLKQAERVAQPEIHAEPAIREGRYDPLRDTEREVERAQFKGRYDELRAAEPPPEIVREFEANAGRTTEPAAPIYDRDADNEAWEAKLTEAAIAGAEADYAPQEARQWADADQDRETPEAAAQWLEEPDSREETIEAWAQRHTESEAARSVLWALPRIRLSSDRRRQASSGGLAKAAEHLLGGLMDFFGMGDTKLSPLCRPSLPRRHARRRPPPATRRSHGRARMPCRTTLFFGTIASSSRKTLSAKWDIANATATGNASERGNETGY